MKTFMTFESCGKNFWREVGESCQKGSVIGACFDLVHFKFRVVEVYTELERKCRVLCLQPLSVDVEGLEMRVRVCGSKPPADEWHQWDYRDQGDTPQSIWHALRDLIEVFHRA